MQIQCEKNKTSHRFLPFKYSYYSATTLKAVETGRVTLIE